MSVSLAVVGSVNLDFVATVERLPRAGETIGGASLHRHPGGKGANQALAARRLGAHVALHARVGRDAMADEALALLRGEGVDLTQCIAVADAPTGVALIAVAPGGENQIVVALGANAVFAPSALTPIAADALLCQLEIPIETVSAAVNGFAGFVSLNLAPALPVPQAFARRADLIVVNESEAAAYGDALHHDAKRVAVTYGAQGAALFERGQEIARASPPRVRAIDATGAGDAFSAALTLALVEGMPPERALAFACATGAIAATRAGAQPSLPTRAEVEAILAGGAAA